MINNTTYSKKYFKTSDINLASALVTKGKKLLHIELNNQGMGIFVFNDGKTLQNNLQLFNNHSITVNLSGFLKARAMILSEVNDARINTDQPYEEPYDRGVSKNWQRREYER